MKLNLTHKHNAASKFSSRQPKTQGLKIREKKLEAKYKNLMQKHNTLNKFTNASLYDIDVLELDEAHYAKIQPKKIQATVTKQPGKVFSLYMQKDKTENQNLRTKKQYQFLTARDLREKTLGNDPSILKNLTKINKKEKIQTVKQIPSLEDPTNSFLSQSMQLSNLHSTSQQKLQTQEFIHKLDTQQSYYSSMWQKFLKSVKQIQRNQQELCLTHVCEKDRKVRLVENFMKEMDFLLEQHDQHIIQVAKKLCQIRQNELKKLYIYLHQLHKNHMHAKTVIIQHNLEYQKYLAHLKQQQKQRRQMLQSKRQLSLNKSQLNSRTNSPLRHLHHDLNINEKDIRQMMQQKSKLNLELDLSFQIQQRKRIAKEKEIFNQKKSKLQKDKAFIEGKMKQIKQKIEFKEKETERYEFQKDKYQKERDYFLKMLLKNSDYRFDGVLWTFKKMIEYGHQPHISDFSHLLDATAKTFLINEFHLMKQQHIYSAKPLDANKHELIKINKSKRPTTRQRVKSVTVSGSELQNNQKSYYNIDDSNSNLPPDFSDKAFFTFGSKNIALKQPPNNLSIRKKSNSFNLIKTYEESLGKTQQNSSRFNNKDQSFKSLTKENNRNKLYLSAQKYIKNWVSEQGWNICTSKTVKKVEDHHVEDKFISDQKTRAKQKYFKIGRPNTRYNSIVKTLYGSEEELKTATARRIKTSRQ